MPKHHPRYRTYIGASAIAALGTQLMAPPAAFGYDGTNAANYAEQWANGHNGNYPNFSPVDCTNFVSQGLRAGGFPLTDGNRDGWGIKDQFDWWDITSYEWAHIYTYLSAQNSYTASVVPDLKNFFNNVPGPSWLGTWNWTNWPYYPQGLLPGDVVFYDWTNSGTSTHDSMKVGNGTDPHGIPGDWVDQHDSHTNQHNNWTDLDDGDTTWMETKINAYHV